MNFKLEMADSRAIEKAITGAVSKVLSKLGRTSTADEDQDPDAIDFVDPPQRSSNK